MNRFQSSLSERLAGYVKLQRRLGLRFDKQEEMLRTFDRYVHERDYRGPLTEELARTFAMSMIA